MGLACDGQLSADQICSAIAYLLCGQNDLGDSLDKDLSDQNGADNKVDKCFATVEENIKGRVARFYCFRV